MGVTSVPSPKPQPPALKLITGRGPGRDSGGRPVKPGLTIERIAPEPPDWLPAEAQAEWSRVVPELERLGIISVLNRASLVAYCLAWNRLYEAQLQISRGDVTTRGSQGQLVKHPAVLVAESASKDLRGWAGEFGLTPSSEAGVLTSRDDDGQAGNPFAAATC
jgi:P27 family predicted phage terminase small subunit